MRRFQKMVKMTAASLSLAIAVLMTALWSCSSVGPDQVFCVIGHQRIYARTSSSQVMLLFDRSAESTLAGGWEGAQRGTGGPRRFGKPMPAEFRSFIAPRAVGLPYPIVVFVSLIAPTWVTKNWIQRRRTARAGRCPTCGYDLRATPARCPECGTTRVEAVE